MLVQTLYVFTFFIARDFISFLLTPYFFRSYYIKKLIRSSLISNDAGQDLLHLCDCITCCNLNDAEMNPCCLQLY